KMKLDRAHEILNLPKGSSKEEAKKKYKEAVKLNHPDVNKSPDAEDKIKQINEAYQVIQTGQSTDIEDRHHQSHSYGHTVVVEHIEATTHISFKESVLGCKKEISYTRQTKCKSCNGDGQTKINNGCKKCGGKGQTTIKQGSMI